ncbi:hypothetical protein GTA62_11435 [Roseobacter sp. HKCCD9010]|nr:MULTISPECIES: hypothetical protein [unclassified Roseobacter]NNV16088.1 hypothetical protein [Roseobacter sp. HKCCD8768]NNV25548.1 hypothetical protein [Roseobacter sp. HKCCD8192]NNV34380.1 hypothetical protein [Roseobacter sp. HKCCD9073]NNV68117.1 hypothetical protein [Roseobacter sp. HKCCD8474]NNV72383.1 hypothetical protein [Roseobacter sp. HKCCD5932]NNV76757.1 hypothetical protein [Roseobacter sp. HKCCD6135]NNV97936.1 hypothetical protein [Roseobacter sp. HKCCD6505]NNW15260.1 hypothe
MQNDNLLSFWTQNLCSFCPAESRNGCVGDGAYAYSSAAILDPTGMKCVFIVQHCETLSGFSENQGIMCWKLAYTGGVFYS